jgi:hypothetical protein
LFPPLIIKTNISPFFPYYVIFYIYVYGLPFRWSELIRHFVRVGIVLYSRLLIWIDFNLDPDPQRPFEDNFFPQSFKIKIKS